MSWEDEECIHVPGMKAKSCGMCLMDMEPPAPTPSAATIGQEMVDYGPFAAQYPGTCKGCGFDVARGDQVFKLVGPGVVHDRCVEEEDIGNGPDEG